MPVGSEFLLLTVSGAADVTAAETYLKVASGAYGWAKYAVGSTTLSSAGNFDATTNAMMSVWGASSSTTATRRAISARLSLTGTGTEDGEAGRFYTLVTGVVTGSGIHGIHATAQVGDETTGTTTSSCSGEMAGIRATIGTGPTMTIAAGTYSSLRLDTYLQTSLASLNCQFINMSDVGTYGVTEIIRLGTIVSKTTSKTTITAAYAYVSGGMTIGAATAALRVVTPDGAFYIPLVAASALT
jgi:hypothetical protein